MEFYKSIHILQGGSLYPPVFYHSERSEEYEMLLNKQFTILTMLNLFVN